MDALCETAASGDPAEYRKVNSLRYAVTELIGAAETLAKLADDASTEGRFADGIGDELDALEAVQAALARVKGGAA
ncbi:hypothetical protein DBR20_20945 [Stenotrophomonas sp. HMWF023]|nr:hypothetical protein DBR20_20945 [Stenotrophomonas sp. HMWF023]